ncbi:MULTISPECIES: hypothetical protein [Aerosakkonema]|uniref:hypothetical protein n=1 Tax=Aerosakkonema TaxID=1246629 RepID=UPI0035B82B85
MSFDEQNLEAFLELLNDKRSRLFTPQDIASLTKLIDSVPDDIEKLSVAIASWYEKRPKILDAQLDILNNKLSNTSSFNRVSDSNVGDVNSSENQLNKQVLQKAIEQTSVSVTPRTSTPRIKDGKFNSKY